MRITKKQAEEIELALAAKSMELSGFKTYSERRGVYFFSSFELVSSPGYKQRRRVLHFSPVGCESPKFEETEVICLAYNTLTKAHTLNVHLPGKCSHYQEVKP